MGIADFFRILKQVEGSAPGSVEQFFASHPMTEDRIADVTQRIAENPRAAALVESGRKDAPEFERLKAAVHRLPPPPDAKPSTR